MAGKRTANEKEVELNKRAAIALEDLSYSLKKLRPEHIEAALSALRSAISEEGARQGVQTYQSPNPNKHFLIGVLPRLLMDRQMFPSNEDVAQFAIETMRFSISRYEKLAREDLIGKIVCRADKLNDSGLSDLVSALGNIVNDTERIAVIVAQKKSGSFSWNQAIQDLVGDNSHGS